MPKIRTLSVFLPVCCVLFLSACGASVGSNSVSKSDVEAGAKRLTSKAPSPITTVSCPGDLAGKIGASETCTLTLANGNKYSATATVGSVKNNNIHVNYLVTGKIG